MNETMSLQRPRRWLSRRVVIGGSVALVVVAAAGTYWFQPQKIFVDDKVNEALPAQLANLATTTSVAPVTTAATAQSSALTAPVSPSSSSSASVGTAPASPAPSTQAGSTPASAATSPGPASSLPASPAPALSTPAPASSIPAPASTTTAPNGPVELSRGTFRSLEHTTTGHAVVFDLGNGSRLLRLEELDTSNGPDLRVIVSSAPLSDDWRVWGKDYIEIARLKGNVGSQNYELPADLDLARYGRVVIWCDRFDVGFGVAEVASG